MNLNEKLVLINNSFENSNCKIKCPFFKNGKFYTEIIYIENKEINLNVLAKNIVDSGRIDKPYIKRIQVPSLLNTKIPINDDNNITLFLGFYKYKSKLINVIRNPLDFVYHKTVRSCYVHIENIEKLSIYNFLDVYDSDKRIMVTYLENLYDSLIYYRGKNKI